MDETICVDTSILIDHRRTRPRQNSVFFDLSWRYELAVSSITVFEVWKGDSTNETDFWEAFFERIQILAFDTTAAKIAGHDYLFLEKSGQLIGAEDVLISATAKRHNLRLATTNVNHFSRIQDLQLVDL